MLNTNLITNLPAKAAVEVACLVDRNGVQGTHVGDLPEVCAALNRTNINPQILTVEAALSGVKDYVYQAAMLDPHTAAELTIDQIRDMCDDLFEAHGEMIPAMRAAPQPVKAWKPGVFGAQRSEPAQNWRVSRLQEMPEEGVAAAPAVRLSDRKPGWADLRCGTLDGFADVHRLHREGDGLIYLGCHVRVAKSGKWVLALGHDGGAAMFVDGQRVLLEPKLVNPCKPGRSRATVSLSKGSHEVVVAFDIAGGMGWGVYLHCEACNGKAAAFPKFL